MQLQVGVKVFLQNSDQKFLLVHRSSEKYPHVINRWDIVGGRIDPGKSLTENLRREVFEETRIKLNDQKPHIMDAQDILLPEKHIVRLTYYLSLERNPEVIIDDEHDNYIWVSYPELAKQAGLDEFVKTLLPRLVLLIDQK